MSGETVFAILAMAAATYATRISGMLIGNWLPQTGRMKRALDALPAAVLTALITPSVLAGPAEMTAGAVTALAALRLPIIAAVGIGMGTAALMRAFG